MDYQIWAGPALGAFNAWAKGSYLDDYKARNAVDLAKHLMVGAAYQSRINLLLSQGEHSGHTTTLETAESFLTAFIPIAGLKSESWG